MAVARAWTLIAVMAGGASCGSGLYDGRGRSDVQMVGEAGGTLVSFHRKLKVIIPPGALTTPLLLSIKEDPPAPWTIGNTYRFTPDALPLRLPASVELSEAPREGHRNPPSLASVTPANEPVSIPQSWSDGQSIRTELRQLSSIAALQPPCTEQVDCSDGYRCDEGTCRACESSSACQSALGRPGPHNTGVPAGTALQRIDGDWVMDTPDAVVEGKDIRGRVFIRANNVTLRRSVIRPPSPGDQSSGIVEIEASGALLEDLEIFSEDIRQKQVGIRGGSFTARRLNVHGVAIGLTPKSGTRVESSWVHGLANPGGEYAVNIFEGSDITLTGNNLNGPATAGAAILINQSEGPTSNVRVEGNWLDNGGCILNFSHLSGGTMNGMVAHLNRFGTHSSYACAILKSTQTQLSAQGNVWDATGVAVSIEEHD